MFNEVPLDLRESPHLYGREVELEDEERIMERRRVASDVGLSEEFVETILEVDVVVVRKHRTDDRFAKPLWTQEHGSVHILQLADVGRVVNKQAFPDQFGPVDDAVWYLAFFLQLCAPVSGLFLILLASTYYSINLCCTCDDFAEVAHPRIAQCQNW